MSPPVRSALKGDRIHIWREHVANQETGEFKQYTGHSYIAGSFHELDAELQRHQHESPNKKWHRTYRYLHQDRDPSDEPHHCKSCRGASNFLVGSASLTSF